MLVSVADGSVIVTGWPLRLAEYSAFRAETVTVNGIGHL
jgi:hypothetical protein